MVFSLNFGCTERQRESDEHKQKEMKEGRKEREGKGFKWVRSVRSKEEKEGVGFAYAQGKKQQQRTVCAYIGVF